MPKVCRLGDSKTMFAIDEQIFLTLREASECGTLLLYMLVFLLSS